MDWFSALILGIVEGVTEFLPISSTGHLLLAERLLGIPETEFWKSFAIVIQFGAILSVVALYRRSFLDRSQLLKIITAFLPTALLGVIFYPFIKGFLLESEAVVLWALLLGGIFLIIFEIWHGRKKEGEAEEGVAVEMKELSYPKALAVGLFQSIAMIPGVSRSAATIVGGLAMGLPRRLIVEFSFLLAVPTMLGATVLDLSESWQSFAAGDLAVLAIGFIVSFIVALLSIKFLLAYIRRHTFIAFGIYRIFVALVFWLILF